MSEQSADDGTPITLWDAENEKLWRTLRSTTGAKVDVSGEHDHTGFTIHIRYVRWYDLTSERHREMEYTVPPREVSVPRVRDRLKIMLRDAIQAARQDMGAR